MDAVMVKPETHEVTESNLVFRGYELMPEDRLLLRDGCAVDLGGRAFDLLCILVRARGNVVSKAEIFDHVWPSTTVDESNLRFQMAQLRRALGPDRDVIKTVKGRGYILAAEVRRASAAFPDFADLIPDNTVALHRLVSNDAVNSADSGMDPELPVVAVIDDDDGTREALDGLLRSVGLRPDVFASVKDFVLGGRQHLACCLILDVWMPGRTGLDFQEELRREAPDLPIIFISGHADVQMSVRAMKAGAVEFLTKPVHYQDLLAAVEHVVTSRYGRCGTSVGTSRAMASGKPVPF
jgi:DNA-binding response OmpR family regulator